MDRDERLPFVGEVIRETEKAWLFKTDHDEQYWLPKSQCTWDDDTHRMWVPNWLVEEKEMY